MGKPESCFYKGEVILLANFCKGNNSYALSEQEKIQCSYWIVLQLACTEWLTSICTWPKCTLIIIEIWTNIFKWSKPKHFFAISGNFLKTIHKLVWMLQERILVMKEPRTWHPKNTHLLSCVSECIDCLLNVIFHIILTHQIIFTWVSLLTLQFVSKALKTCHYITPCHAAQGEMTPRLLDSLEGRQNAILNHFCLLQHYP